MRIETEMERIDYIIICIIAIVSFAIVYPLAIMGFDPHHTGLMFQMAHDVANGKKMFSEVFNQYGVLPVLIQASYIRLFGDNVHSVVLSTVITYVVAYCLNYLCFFRFLGRILSCLSTVVLLLIGPFYFVSWTFLPWSSVYAIMFTMLTMFFFEEYLIHKSTVRLVLCSTCAFCVFLSRQPVGIVLILSFAVIAVSFKVVKINNIGIREWIIWWLTIISLFFSYNIFIIIFIGKDGLIDYYLQMYVWPMLWSDSVGGIRSLITHLFPVVGFSLSWTIVPISCLAYYVVSMIISFFRRQNEIDEIVLISFCVFSVASWAQYYPITCIRHLFWAIFPMIGVWLWILLRIIYEIPKLLNNKYVFGGENKDNNLYKHIKVFPLIVMIITLSVWGREMGFRVKNGIIKLRSDYLKVQYDNGCGYLDGLLISPMEIEYYSNIHSCIMSLGDFTKKPLLNMTRDAYWSTFYNSDKEPLFLFGGLADVIYPNYAADIYNYIRSEHPIIIKYSNSVYENNEYLDSYSLYKRITGGEKDDGVLEDIEIYIYKE